MKVRLKILLLWATGIVSLTCGSTSSSVRITGRMLCHGKPAQYVEMQLINDRMWPLANIIMAENVFTDPNGDFEIAGYDDRDVSDARLYIWHRCFPRESQQSDPCYNWFEIEIPRVHVQDGPFAEKAWKLGEIGLETPRGEKLDRCD